MKALKTLWKDETGTVAVEYALLLALIAVGTISAYRSLAEGINNTVAEATNAVTNH